MSFVYGSAGRVKMEYTAIMFGMLSAFILRRGEANFDGPAYQDYLIDIGDSDVRCLKLTATHNDGTPRIELFSYSRISIMRISVMGNPLTSPFIVSEPCAGDFTGFAVDAITVWAILPKLIGIFENYLKCLRELNGNG